MKVIRILYPASDIVTVHREWFADGSKRVVVAYTDGASWTVGPPPDGKYRTDGTREFDVWHNRWEVIA